MSFSTEAKNELTRIKTRSEEERLSELAGIVRLAGSMQISGFRKMNLKIITELNSIARRVFKLLKYNFDINTAITVNKNQLLKRNNSYVLTVKSEMGAENLLKELGVLEKGEGFFPKNKISEELIKTEEQRKAFIRGAFLGGGSISDPEKNYHLEFVTNNSEFAEDLKNLINSFGFNCKIVQRKNNFVIYLKESEQISDLLNLMGAYNALLKLQNVKVVKEMRNNVNRIVNCETANLTKAVNAAVKQADNIRIIEQTIGIKNLPENLQQIALIRIENEELTLKELGEMLTPPIGKSGVNHRLRKIQEIADDLREKYNIE